MSDKQDTREMLVSGNVFKTMLTLSVPAVLQFWHLQDSWSSSCRSLWFYHT